MGYYSEKDLMYFERLLEEKERMEKALNESIASGDICRQYWAEKGLEDVLRRAREPR